MDEMLVDFEPIFEIALKVHRDNETLLEDDLYPEYDQRYMSMLRTSEAFHKIEKLLLGRYQQYQLEVDLVSNSVDNLELK